MMRNAVHLANSVFSRAISPRGPALESSYGLPSVDVVGWCIEMTVADWNSKSNSHVEQQL